MEKWLSFFLLFGVIFTIFHCTKGVNTIERRPPPVILVPSVPDTCRVERGMDAVPEEDAIRVEWIPSSDELVDTYEVYRAIEEKGSYNVIAAVSDSFFIDRSVSLNSRYFYYVLAVSDEGVKSEPSDTLNYMLIEKAKNLLPKSSATSCRPVFSWEDPNGEYAYIVRLVDVASQKYVWLSVVPSTYSARESVAFNEDQSATVDSLSSGSYYTWRVDVVSSKDHCGSESQWVTFRVQ